MAIFNLQPPAMWGSCREQVRQLPQVNAITLLEGNLTDGVLLDMMIAAETD